MEELPLLFNIILVKRTNGTSTHLCITSLYIQGTRDPSTVVFLLVNKTETNVKLKDELKKLTL